MKPVISNVNPEQFDISSRTLEVYLPHHLTVTIRERNGEDESILSRMEDFTSGIAIPKFLSSILVEPKLTPQEIQAWPVRSKWYLMYKERMWQYSSLVSWDQSFDYRGQVFSVPYEEDIQWFDRDLKNGQEVEKEGQIIAYPKDSKHIIHTTASGKVVRMNYLTGEAEQFLLESKTMDNLDINDRLRIRNFELQDNKGTWHKVDRFNMFTGRDMQEIRKYLEGADPDFNLNVSVKNPKTGDVTQVTLMQILSFFFQ